MLLLLLLIINNIRHMAHVLFVPLFKLPKPNSEYLLPCFSNRTIEKTSKII